jgi:hypothetical protein
MENITIRPGSITIRKRKRYSDPRALQIDLDTDWVNTKEHPDKSIHSDRVMPMANMKKFLSLIKRKTKTFRGIDASHFWVSGYYALYFYMQSKNDSRKIKQIVQAAYKESGGSMSFDAWYIEHNKKHTRIMQYNGTGSGITKTYDNLPNHIAYL